MGVAAPGKLFLLGEYAVLSGAPAIVAAIDRYARVERVASAPTARLLDAAGSMPIDAAHPNPLIAAVAGALAAARVTPWPGVYAADSSALSAAAKLGLGSSAAVAAALVASLAPPAAQPATLLSVALDAHRRFQGGRGSGGDVIAACFGGVAEVRAAPGAAPAFVTRVLPDGLQFAALFTGVPADTRAGIDAFERWRPTHRAALSGLIDAAELGAAALARGDAGAWLDAVAAYAERETVMTAQGVPIVTAPVRAAIEAAFEAGWVAKPSGAGGGDVVIAFAHAGGDVDALARACVPRGVQHVPLALAPRGALNHAGAGDAAPFSSGSE